MGITVNLTNAIETMGRLHADDAYEIVMPDECSEDDIDYDNFAYLWYEPFGCYVGCSERYEQNMSRYCEPAANTGVCVEARQNPADADNNGRITFQELLEYQVESDPYDPPLSEDDNLILDYMYKIMNGNTSRLERVQAARDLASKVHELGSEAEAALFPFFFSVSNIYNDLSFAEVLRQARDDTAHEAVPFLTNLFIRTSDNDAEQLLINTRDEGAVAPLLAEVESYLDDERNASWCRGGNPHERFASAVRIICELDETAIEGLVTRYLEAIVNAPNASEQNLNADRLESIAVAEVQAGRGMNSIALKKIIEYLDDPENDSTTQCVLLDSVVEPFGVPMLEDVEVSHNYMERVSHRIFSLVREIYHDERRSEGVRDCAHRAWYYNMGGHWCTDHDYGFCVDRDDF